MLLEYQETASYTNYSFEYNGKTLSDFIEIASYVQITETSVEEITFNIVITNYDIKKSRLQLKRVRDILSYPPLVNGQTAKAGEENDANNTRENEAKKDEIAKKEIESLSLSSTREKLPTINEIFQQSKLESFYSETLLRSCSSDVTTASSVKTLSDCVKSVALSG